jgi:hypothetical protein
MLAKIGVQLSNRRFSVRYDEENDNDKRGDNLRKLKTQWASFVLDLLVEIVENKAAVVHVYSSDGDFKFPDINAKIWTHIHNGITYFLAASNTWNKSDIIEITSLMQFELSTLWIQIVPEIDESHVDPVAFFRSIDKIVMGEEEEDSNFQCIGNTEDGNVIIWDNPNCNEVEYLIPKLKTVCSMNGFECEVNDKRNKN